MRIPQVVPPVFNRLESADTSHMTVSLLERQPQLDELTRHLREASGGTGSVIFVCGEAGAGKSALVEQFAQASEKTARAIWGYSDALQTSRVLGPVNEVLAGLSLSPEVHRDPALSREQLFARLFERLSAPNPLSVVVLEDLHWADEATLDFVRFLGRRIQRTRCLLIGTYRDDELAPTHPLRSVLGELTGRHVARVRLPPLSLAAVEQLARGTQRNPAQIHEISGGNPFFVRELLSTPVATVPDTVRDAVLARLMQCSPAARELTELVSLMPGRAEPWLIRSFLGDARAADDEAVARGLLRHQDESLAFRHELGRLAVESAIPRGRAQEMHQSVLHKLIEHGADLSQVVHHATLAQNIEALLEYAPRAAEQATRAGAHREAAAHLVTALKHGDKLATAERARLLELYANECDLTNEVEESIAAGKEALTLTQAGEVEAQARILLLLERQYWKAGQKRQADEQVDRATALLEKLPPTRQLAMVYSARARLAMTSDQAQEAVEFSERALALAERFGDQEVRAHALNNMGSALLLARNEAGKAKLEQSLALSLEHNLPRHAGRAYANLVSFAVTQHRFALAKRYIAEGTEYCDVHEVQDSLSYVRAHNALFELASGNWDTAGEIATELLEHHKLATAQRVPALLALALVRARRGDPGVDTLLEQAASLAAPTGELQRIGPVAAARAETAWYRGDLARAAKEATLGLQAMGEKGDGWVPGELSFWGRRANPALTIPANIAEPYALMIAGKWEEAAAAWQELGAPYHRALALSAGSIDAQREALTILEQLGAGPLAALVRHRLRELGVHGIPRGPRSSTRENPAGLTAREIQVLGLLVKGHTNNELARRLHISAKTVDHHVSAILQKLEVRSRTEAVAAALGLGIVRAAD
jgi:DNA-binding CsgD family transcriptional regulator/tetratricopeptide (TPR) repeat protein